MLDREENEIALKRYVTLAPERLFSSPLPYLPSHPTLSSQKAGKDLFAVQDHKELHGQSNYGEEERMTKERKIETELEELSLGGLVNRGWL